MWIFTTHGFISVVAHRSDPGSLLVRARRAEHLQAIFPGQPVTSAIAADYRYRTVMPRAVFYARLLGEASAITYDNFKDAIPDADYHDAATTVWDVMRELQPGAHTPRTHEASLYLSDGHYRPQRHPRIP